jgi:hypothetical protein
MGGDCHWASVFYVEWRTSFIAIWNNIRRPWINRDCYVTSRNGFNVRSFIRLAILVANQRLHRDPTVGAQYRWSAKFAPKYPRFFGLLQGKSLLAVLEVSSREHKLMLL